MSQTTPASILIVDDVPTNIQVLAEALRRQYRIKVATNGRDALAVAQAWPQPDLVLLDVMMPAMDGFEVCRRLKANPATRHIPVVFVTAKDDVADEERGLMLGAVDYIAKPFNLPVVRARVRNHLALKLKADLLESLANIDSLTDISNRRRFDEKLAAEWRRCQRSGLPLSLIMIDVDHFKAFNDHFGHGAGDICLITIAATLAANLSRPGDLVARYGGEEFAVILPETDPAGAVRIAERMREALAEQRIPQATGDDSSIVTLSAGVAGRVPDERADVAELIAAADRKLYDAKTLGRNRVCS
ncbi:diguanylate cyclase domain-containing protein [Sulfurisoma sediminicola]|uniref:diguanylate cyclase n=1 Tax=Sulfurisoma sediminicola TaxID=1381557 RepID=A0A497XAH4_9PROT|nr:diguanylate cyclase [Sulfurisoma sediminicola]RLJ62646.1 response regulator receiver modulated diguanylate cyclase [Sulfurisoma sediminicola]